MNRITRTCSRPSELAVAQVDVDCGFRDAVPEGLVTPSVGAALLLGPGRLLQVALVQRSAAVAPSATPLDQLLQRPPVLVTARQLVQLTDCSP